MNGEPTKLSTMIVLSIWSVFMIPWLMMAPLSLMVFDGGHKPAGTYIGVLGLLTYPIVLLAAFIFRKRSTVLLWLPLLNLILVVLNAISII